MLEVNDEKSIGHVLVQYSDKVVLKKVYYIKIDEKEVELRLTIHLANNKQEIEKLYNFFGECINNEKIR